MIIIAIGGAHSAGKSVVAQKLQEYYGTNRCQVLSLNNYFRDYSDLSTDQSKNQSDDCPSHIDFQLLTTHLETLKAGKSIQIQDYNTELHAKTTESHIMIPCEVLLVEGSLALHADAPISLYNIKIFVDSELDLCLARSIRQSTLDGKSNIESLLMEYELVTKPQYVEFIMPTQKIADVVIQNNKPGFNPDFTEILDFIASETTLAHSHRMMPNIISPTFNVLEKSQKQIGTLFVISGPSGVGKSTILRAFLQRNPAVKKVIGFTTRAQRDTEIDGEDCHFITREKFASLRSSTHFLQHIEAFGDHYGMLAPEVLMDLSEGKSLIMDITPEALIQVRKKVKKVKAIFICPPSMSAIGERLLARGDEATAIEKRYTYSVRMLEQASLSGYDYLIVNSDLITATDALAAIVFSEHTSLARQQAENASLLRRFKLYPVLARIKQHQLPSLNIEQCEISPLSSLCNSSYHLIDGSEAYFLRVLRHSNDQYRISPEQEQANLQRMSQLELYPPVLFYDTQFGYYMTQFLNQYQLLTPDQLASPSLFKAVIEAIKRLHQSAPLDNDSSLLSNLEPTLIQLIQLRLKFPEDITRIAVICHRIAILLDKTCQQKVPSNNDISPYNILHHEGRIVISDWEYSGNNDPFWDIAKLSVEAHFTEIQDRQLLIDYCGAVTDYALARLTLFKLLIEFHLAIWLKWQIATKNDAAQDWQFDRMFSVRLDNCRKHISSSAFDKNTRLVLSTLDLDNPICASRILLPHTQSNSVIVQQSTVVMPLKTPSLKLNRYASLFNRKTHTPAAYVAEHEQTLVIIKPDILTKNKIGDVISFLERMGLSVVGIKLKELTLNEVEALYPKIAIQCFRYDVFDLMTSGPIAILVLEGINAAAKLIQFKGATDPLVAEPGTLRKLFGTDAKWNAVHCSDNASEARREISLFFKTKEIFSHPNLANSTQIKQIHALS